MISSLVISDMDIAASFRAAAADAVRVRVRAAVRIRGRRPRMSSASPSSLSSSPPPARTRSVFTAKVSPVALCTACARPRTRPVPMASPTSYSDANGRCRWTVPMDSTCGEVSSSCKPAGAERERRNARTRRSDASLLNASSPEHRAGAGRSAPSTRSCRAAGARARGNPPPREGPAETHRVRGRRGGTIAPRAPPPRRLTVRARGPGARARAERTACRPRGRGGPVGGRGERTAMSKTAGVLVNLSTCASRSAEVTQTYRVRSWSCIELELTVTQPKSPLQLKREERVADPRPSVAHRIREGAPSWGGRLLSFASGPDPDPEPDPVPIPPNAVRGRCHLGGVLVLDPERAAGSATERSHTSRGRRCRCGARLARRERDGERLPRAMLAEEFGNLPVVLHRVCRVRASRPSRPPFAMRAAVYDRTAVEGVRVTTRARPPICARARRVVVRVRPCSGEPPLTVHSVVGQSPQRGTRTRGARWTARSRGST